MSLFGSSSSESTGGRFSDASSTHGLFGYSVTSEERFSLLRPAPAPSKFFSNTKGGLLTEKSQQSMANMMECSGFSGDELLQIGLSVMEPTMIDELMKYNISVIGYKAWHAENQKQKREQIMKNLRSEQCSICLESYIGKTVAITPCMHHMCAGCALQQVYKNLSSAKKCPCCRAPVNEMETVDIALEEQAEL